MKRIHFPPVLALLSLLALGACGEAEDTRPGQPVAHRKQAFKDIFESFDPMGALLKKEKLDSDTFRTLAHQLAARRDGPWQYFGPDTLYPPSHSRQEIWSEPVKFEKARNDFLAAVGGLAKAADGPDRAAKEAAFAVVRDSCETCHKAFKKRSE